MDTNNDIVAEHEQQNIAAGALADTLKHNAQELFDGAYRIATEHTNTSDMS